MGKSIEILEVTNLDGVIVLPQWLLKSETVHRQLRPALPNNYVEKMTRVFADGGRMVIAAEKDIVLGIGIFRVYENTFDGIHMYVDDLITDERKRSTGVGRALLEHLQQTAKTLGCTKVTLDSGTHRQQAHKFYFREGMVISSFHFFKNII